MLALFDSRIRAKSRLRTANEASTWASHKSTSLNSQVKQVLGQVSSYYIGWYWRNFRISYLCQLFFSAMKWGRALRNVCYCDITLLLRYSDNTDIFKTSWLHCAWVVDDAKCILVTRICLSVCLPVCLCLSAAARPQCCTGPDVTCGNGRGAPSCALLDGFARRVLSLWQHSAARIGNRCTCQHSGEREMPASTCLYSLYACFDFVRITRRIFPTELHTVRRIAPHHRDYRLQWRHFTLCTQASRKRVASPKIATWTELNLCA